MSGESLIAEIKAAARGKWPTVYAFLGKCDSSIFDGKPHPCPKCGGKDRFRFTNMDEDGSIICNQCGRDIGDGIAGLEWLNGEDTKTTIRFLADHLHIGRKAATNGNHGPNGHAPKSPPVDKPKVSSDEFEKQFSRWDPKLHNINEKFSAFAEAKRPITLDAIIQSGAIVCTWPNSNNHGKKCIAWPAYNNPGELTGYILRRIDGQEFEAFGSLAARKTHMLRGSHDGWVIPGGFDRVARASVVWRVEGVPDALAMFSHLPPNHAVVTNICGAGSVKDLNLEILRGKTVFSVGDADEPGQEGASKFADAAAAVASEARIVKLPFEIDETHGRDVRDYFTDGNTFDQLLSIANSSEIVEKPVEAKTPSIKIRKAGELVKEFTELRPAIIDKILRIGEVMNLIASPKTKKSWLVMALALTVLMGWRWLGKYYTRAGRVLVIDNELHAETFADRLRKVAESMQIPTADYAERLSVINLRGQQVDLNKIAEFLKSLEPGQFDLIICDAFYRFLPEGVDENSNADITALYNTLDSVWERTGAAGIVVHHSSKGSQSGKSVTDTGSGAGAMSRAADTHVVLRQHEQPDVAVFESVTRSFPPNEPECIRWVYPQWVPADDLDPTELKQEKPKRKTAASTGPTKEEKAKEVYSNNREKLSKVLAAFTDGDTASQLAEKAGMSNKVAGPILMDLLEAKVIEKCTIVKNKASHQGFRLVLTRPNETVGQVGQVGQISYESDLSDRIGGVGRTSAPPLGGTVLSDHAPPVAAGRENERALSDRLPLDGGQPA